MVESSPRQPASKPQKRRTKRLAGTKYWLALGTLAAHSTFAPSGLLHAQEPATGATSQEIPTRNFDIPPGALGRILRQFSIITASPISLANDSIAQLDSPGVRGHLTHDAALSQILHGTGASYRRRESVIEIYLRSADTSVDVTAESKQLPSSPKFTQDVIDTPQTIDAVSQKTMSEHGVTTLRDALRNVAGISLAAGEGGAQGDNLTIRGFTARNDIFLDGMRDFGSYYRDPFDLDTVQVLQGPSSMLFGRGSTGGVVEQETKQPEPNKFVAGDLQFGSDLTRRITADINAPVHSLPAGSAFRLNLMGHDSQVAGRDIAKNRRFGVAPSLAIPLSPNLQLTLNYLHEAADDTPDYGIPWLFNAPAPVPRNNYYGFRHGNFLRTDVDVFTTTLNAQLAPHLRLHEQVRYANYGRDVRITEPRIAANTPLTTPVDRLTVTRNQIAVNSTETFLQNQTDLVADFRTGFLSHTIVTGIEGGRETSSPTRYAFTGVPTTKLLDPNENQSFAGTSKANSKVHTTALDAGAYAIDTVKIGNRWQMSGGLRWDCFGVDYLQSVAPAVPLNRVDNMVSWRGAVLFKPAQNGSIYFDAGTSFNPSAESLALSVATAFTSPEKNLTFEIGSKWEFPQHHLSLRASIFRTNKTNAREPDPNNPLVNALGGSQRVNGLEFEASGHITRRWEVQSSYALLASRVTDSKYYPAAIGAPLANVPRNTLSIWSTYETHWRLEFGGGAQFVGARSASSTIPYDPTTGLLRQVAGYWTFNSMASYRVSERIALQANMINLTNNYYIDQVLSGHIVPGAARSILTAIKFKF
jgi:catecholate siderophore receptor